MVCLVKTKYTDPVSFVVDGIGNVPAAGFSSSVLSNSLLNVVDVPLSGSVHFAAVDEDILVLTSVSVSPTTSPSLIENDLYDFSSFSNDITDFIDVCFPDSLSDVLVDDFVPTPDDVDEVLFTNKSLVLPIVNRKRASLAGRFGIVAVAESKNVRKGVMRCSEASERWAVRCFNDWRMFRGFLVEKLIGELSEENDLRPFADILTKFILEGRFSISPNLIDYFNLFSFFCLKLALYILLHQLLINQLLNCSIGGLVRAIGRLIRARQDEHIIEISIQELKFNILQGIPYEAV
jgi:hypothetical protein